MGVTFLAPAGTYTSPATLTTKEITANGTYNASDDNANGYSSVKVTVEGGGGGDFTTATLSISTSSTYEFGLAAPVLIEAEGNAGIVPYFTNSSIRTGDYTIVMAASGAMLTFIFQSQDTPVVTVTGDIVDLGGGNFMITGNGTMAIADDK